MKWYFDTSVIVAASVASHTHNAAAAAVLDALVAGKHDGYVSAHSLTEVYSVLTRTPFPLRLQPDQVLRLIETSILGCMKLVTLDAGEYEDVVRRSAAHGWIGGRIHDVIHLQCAAKMECDRIYTLNEKDFVALSPAALADKIVALIA